MQSEWDSYRWRSVIGPVGGLVDEEGLLYRRPSEVCAKADPSAIADEMEAQFDRLAQGGLTPTNIDAHIGNARLPPFGSAIIELGKRHNVPVLTFRNANVLW